MVTSRTKWVVTASGVVIGVSVCVAVAAVFPQFVMAAVVGIVAAVVVPPIVVAAVFVVVPPSTARVVRDEMDRVVRVLGPGEHLVIPPLERLSESFSLCWQAMLFEDIKALDAQGVEMEVQLKLLYVVDPRAIRADWRQAILDALHDNMALWQKHLRGIVLEQLQLLLAHWPAEKWIRVAGRHALRAWLMERINGRVAGTGVQIQDIQVLWLAPAQPVRQFYLDARRRAIAAASWSMALRTLRQDGLAELEEVVRQVRELATADALAGRNDVTLHMGPMLGWYVPSGNGNGHGSASSEIGLSQASGRSVPAGK